MAISSTEADHRVWRPAASGVRDGVAARAAAARPERFAVTASEPERRPDPADRSRRESPDTTDRAAPAPDRSAAQERPAAPASGRADRPAAPAGVPAGDAPIGDGSARQASDTTIAWTADMPAAETGAKPAAETAAKPTAETAAKPTAETAAKTAKRTAPAETPAFAVETPTGDADSAATRAGVAQSAAVAGNTEAGTIDEAAGTDVDEETLDAASTGTGAPAPDFVLPPPLPSAVPAQTAGTGSPGASNAEAASGAIAGAAKASGGAVARSGPAGHGPTAGGPLEGDETGEPGEAGRKGGFEALVAASPPTDRLVPPDPAAVAPGVAAGSGSAAPGAAPADPKAQPQALAVPVPLGAVPMTIGLRSLAGSSRFEISLDPKDLGRIAVKLDIDKEGGTVTAHLVVDRPETLALLQRDAGSLQQALSQTGLDAGDGAIQLSLRSDTGPGGQGGERRAEPGPRGPAQADDSRITLDTTPLRALRGLGGLDIRI